MGNQDKLIAQLFKDTTIIFLLTFFAATIGSIIDGMITSNLLGTSSIAAFGLTMPYQKFVFIFPSVITLGMQILCSQSLGKGNLREANGIFSLTVTLGLVVAFIMMIATFLFTEELSMILGVDREQAQLFALTIEYIEPYALGLPAIALTVILTPIMQLDSDKSRAVVSVVALSFSNIVFDLISVYVFDAELWGIGLATTLSYWLSAGILFLHFLKKDASFTFVRDAISIKFLRGVILNGSVRALGMGANMLRMSALNRVALATAGEMALGAYVIVENFINMLESVPKSFSSAVQMIGGILVGERDKNSLRRLIVIALKYSLVCIVAIALIILFGGAALIADIYTQEDAAQVQFMAEEGIIFATLGLPLYTVIFVFQYLYQACGRFKLANFFAVANNFLFIVPIALFLVPIYGIMGLWLSFLLSRVVGVFAIFIITCWHCKRITFNVEDYLLLPEDFDLPDDKKLDMTVTSKAEVLGLSERAQSFCSAQGIDDKRSMFAGICIEEMAGNIVDYGFNDGKKHFVDVRVIVNGSQVIIRIRDNCRAFDPKKWVQINNPEDPSSHIGIRLVRKIATEFRYVNVLKLNNLTVKI